MGLPNAIETALKIISCRQPEVEKVYKIKRKLGGLGKFTLLRATVSCMDMEMLCEERKIPIRVYYPKREEKADALIIFFHGGGWATGDIESYNKVCINICRQTGCAVSSVEYRLAPENHFPAGLEDCYAVTQHFLRNSKDLFGISADKITLMGDSAGGNLAAAVSTMARDTGDILPKKQILIYPALYNDATLSSPYLSIKKNGQNYVLTAKEVEEYMELYQSRPEDRKSPYFAPLLAGDFSNLPETVIITAEFDPLRDEAEDYGRRLEKAGVHTEIYRISNMIHAFFTLPAGLPQLQKCYKIINRFLLGEGYGKTEKI